MGIKVSAMTASTAHAAADVVYLVDGGASRKMTITEFFDQIPVDVDLSNAAGPSLLNEAATATNPTVLPNRADPDTGVGWQAADVLSLISGGAERARINSTEAIFSGKIKWGSISSPDGTLTFDGSNAYIDSTGDLYLRVSGTTQALRLQSGEINVKIDTTGDAGIRFRVQDDQTAAYSGTAAPDVGGTFQAINNDNSADYTVGLYIATRASNQSQWWILNEHKANTQGDLVFGARDGGATYNEKFRIKNDGTLQFGSHSSIGAETVTGYITVEDSSGASRKLAVVS